MGPRKRLVCTVLALFYGWQAHAAEVLEFDPGYPLPEFHVLDFKGDSSLFPQAGDFALQGFWPMSGALGARWALLHLRNIGSGHRVVSNKHVVALFADGSRRHAQGLDERLSAGEQLSQAVNFGRHRFPIVGVLVRTRR